MPKDCHYEGPPTVENTSAQFLAGERRCQVTLPDDALLYVFDFYLAQTSEVEAWHTLVHVCRRWRILVFGSPRRLNLRILCTDKTPVKEKLDVWPSLPIVVSGLDTETDPDNINAALEHRNRICQIKLTLVAWKDINVASLEEAFPILTDLDLGALEIFCPFYPNPSKFLGGPGSAHLLRSLTLRDVKIPDLLELLLGTPNLVFLCLHKFSTSFPPDEMVTALSSLARLETLELDIEFYRPNPDWENQRLSLPTRTRTVLPSLTMLKVAGDIKHSDDFMAQIDTPLLDHLYIDFPFFLFNQTMVLDTPQLFRYISRTPKLQAPVGAYLGFSADEFCIVFLHSSPISHREVKLNISGIEPKRQIPCVARFYRSLPFLLHPLEYLYICGGQRPQQNLTEHTRWLELLQPFTAVKNLYLTKGFAPHIAHSLQGLVGESVMEVLPTLENVFIEEFEPSGPVHQVIKEFVVARQLAGHPIAISRWDLSIQLSV